MSSTAITDVDYLIVTALKVELEAVRQILSAEQKHQRPGEKTFYLGDVAGSGTTSRVALVLSGPGNPGAATDVTRTVERLNPRYVLMVGIAGGRRDHVRLGDVVVARQVVYPEQAKLTPAGPEIRLDITSADPLLLDRAVHLDDGWSDDMSVTKPGGAKTPPKVHVGQVVASEKVVADADALAALPEIRS